MEKIAFILANFGGPRNLKEVKPFLEELLCDKDLIRSKLPFFIHRLIFRKVAARRSIKVEEDYKLIGGKSPIFEDTEILSKQLSLKLETTFYPFHRYLRNTHPSFIEEIERSTAEKIIILPCFPQYSTATTGSILNFFSHRFSRNTKKKLELIRSYPSNTHYVSAYQTRIKRFLEEQNIDEDKITLLFSAHGIPQSFVKKGDTYQTECEESYHAIKKGFPKAASILCYQSKFGKGKWLMPYTVDVCRNIETFSPVRKKIIFIPLSFISDHIETLYEIEKLYLPIIKRKNYEPYRCPALNLEDYWIDALVNILKPFAIYVK